ncbi:MAG: NAD-dependent epimerase/dehydratase family protein [Bryobacteraceae bacterium]
MPNPLADDLEHVLAHTEGVWDELRGARLFVTGGTGFFGCWLLESFAWAADRMHLDATLTVLTRSPEAFRAKAPHLAGHPSIRLLDGDVRSFEYPAGRFSHVIHAASGATPELCRDRPLAVMDTLVDGTRRVLDFAVTVGARRFLLTSSGAVYGPQPPGLSHLPETWSGAPDPAVPASVYGEGKRAAELLCTHYHQAHGLDCPVARCFTFVGPYMPLDAHFAIGNFLGDQIHGRPIQVRGDGTPLRSYLYAADLAVWLWTILVKGESGKPYNVGSEREVAIADAARAVARSRQPACPVRIARQPAPGAPAQRYVPSTARARNELNLRERVPFEEAIRRTAAAVPIPAQKGE